MFINLSSRVFNTLYFEIVLGAKKEGPVFSLTSLVFFTRAFRTIHNGMTLDLFPSGEF